MMRKVSIHRTVKPQAHVRNGSVRSTTFLRHPQQRAKVQAKRGFSTDKVHSLAEFTAKEQALRERVRKFSNEEIRPKVREMDENNHVDKELLKKMFDHGFMGIETPRALGGLESNFTSSIIVIEELAKADAALSVICDVQNTLIDTTIKKFGNEEQKQKYLPKLAKEYLGSFCLSEWGSGSDAFALKTKAEDKGDHFLLNGTKAWITNSGEAGLFIVMANLDVSKGYKGITAFLVERTNPGLEVGKKEDKVDKKSVLGEIGKGYKIAIETLNEGRIGIAAQMLGLAEGAYEAALPFLQNRLHSETVQNGITQMEADIEAAKLMTYNASRMKDAGKPFVKEAAMAKLFSSQVAERVCSLAINLVGANGYSKSHQLEKYYRDCKIGQIYEGTSNIQLQTIAKWIEREYSVNSMA